MRGWLDVSLAFVLGVMLGSLITIAIFEVRKNNDVVPEVTCYAVQLDSQTAVAMLGEVTPVSPPTQTVTKLCFTEVE